MSDPLTNGDRRDIVASIDLAIDLSDDPFDAEAVRQAVAEESYGRYAYRPGREGAVDQE